MGAIDRYLASLRVGAAVHPSVQQVMDGLGACLRQLGDRTDQPSYDSGHNQVYGAFKSSELPNRDTYYDDDADYEDQEAYEDDPYVIEVLAKYKKRIAQAMRRFPLVELRSLHVEAGDKEYVEVTVNLRERPAVKKCDGGWHCPNPATEVRGLLNYCSQHAKEFDAELDELELER